jgi:chemotaxis protein methyltransferase CheR
MSNQHQVTSCNDLLRWALPVLNKRTAGYRKVRKQVCKRITGRMKDLQLHDFNQYKTWLENHPDEWEVFDEMTFITISRFFRDRWQWNQLADDILPSLTQKVIGENRPLRCWSAGCASGEEPYSMAILWKQRIEPVYPDSTLQLIATDVQQHMLERAREAVYMKGSLKDVPESLLHEAFDKKNAEYHLKSRYASLPEFIRQDIRKEMPEGKFDVIFCKNIVAMYFDTATATEIFRKIVEKINDDGILILGNHEIFPLQEIKVMKPMGKGIFKKV